MNLPINVLQLIHNLKREGAQSIVANLVAQLDSSVINSTVCSWKRDGDFADELRSRGYKIYSMNSASPGLAVFNLYHYIKKNNISLVHAHMSDSTIIAYFACKLAKIPYVVTFHSNQLMPSPSWLQMRLFRLAARKSQAQIAISESVFQKVRSEISDLPNLHTINNGVAAILEDKVGELITARLKRISNGPRLISVGRLVAIKGHEQLLQAVAKLVSTRPGTRLTILGEGDLRTHLENLSRDLALEAYVDFPGAVGNVNEWLAKSDIYLASSIYEGLPIAVAEAMGSGLPVIATDVVGNNDLIIHELTGLRFTLNNISQLVESIENLITHPQLYHHLSKAAYNLCTKDYSAHSMAEKHLAIYKMCLGISNHY